MTGSCRALAEILQRRNHLGGLGVQRKILLKITEKHDVRLCAEFIKIKLRIEFSGRR